MKDVLENESIINHEVHAEELENDGWQTLNWHDWKYATRDKTIKQYQTKQIDEAVKWYCQTHQTTIPEYVKNKPTEEYDLAAQLKIGQAIKEYLMRIDPNTGLKGSEIFSREHLMYRDLPEETIKTEYKKYEEQEKAWQAELLKRSKSEPRF